MEKTVKSVCLHFSSSAHTSTRVGCDPCSPLKMLGKVRPTTGPGGSWPFLSVRQMNSEVRSYFCHYYLFHRISGLCVSSILIQTLAFLERLPRFTSPLGSNRYVFVLLLGLTLPCRVWREDQGCAKGPGSTPSSHIFLAR